MALPTNDPFTPIPMKVLRKGKRKTLSAAYVDFEEEVSGSPFPARFYRKARSTVKDRVEGAAGTSDMDSELTVSFDDTGVPIEDEDDDAKHQYLVVLPPGLAGRKEVRAKVLRVRHYPDCLQCDVQLGPV